MGRTGERKEICSLELLSLFPWEKVARSYWEDAWIFDPWLVGSQKSFDRSRHILNVENVRKYSKYSKFSASEKKVYFRFFIFFITLAIISQGFGKIRYSVLLWGAEEYWAEID